MLFRSGIAAGLGCDAGAGAIGVDRDGFDSADCARWAPCALAVCGADGIISMVRGLGGGSGSPCPPILSARPITSACNASVANSATTGIPRFERADSDIEPDIEADIKAVIEAVYAIDSGKLPGHEDRTAPSQGANRHPHWRGHDADARP